MVTTKVLYKHYPLTGCTIGAIMIR